MISAFDFLKTSLPISGMAHGTRILFDTRTPFNPSHFVPNRSSFRGQRDDENRFSRPFQHRARYTSKKCVLKESFPVTSEDNQIASLFICRFQDLFDGIAYLHDDLG